MYKLLCALALIATSTIGNAQETQEGTGPDAQALDTGVLNAQAVSPLTEAFDADVLDAETRTAGEAALDLVARLEAEILLEELVDQERYDEAIPVAERMADLTEEELGPGLEFGTALTKLAILQRRAELYDQSEQNFLRAVDVVREADGTYIPNTHLIHTLPLAMLC